MKNILKNKIVIIIVLVVIVLGAFSYKLLFANKEDKVEPTKKEVSEDEVIPTIDSSVLVNLTKEQNANELILSVKSFPSGTDKIEYELSYQTAEQGLQGVVGNIDTSNLSNNEYDKKITLGTCSSGRCVYHKVVGSIKLLLKFNGSYGTRIFEKEYSI